MKRDNPELMFKILITLVVVLGLLVLYAFVLKPAMTGYTVKYQNEGVNIALVSIVNQLQQQGYVQIPIGNQTITLVPYQPPQQEEVNLVG